MASIAYIKDISESVRQRFRDVGIYTSEQLLEYGASASGRMRLADQTNTSPEQILDWVEQADLLRVHGVGAQFSVVLQRVGVTSAARLAYRSPEALHRVIQQGLGKRRRLTLPSVHELEQIVRAAKTLPKLVRR